MRQLHSISIQERFVASGVYTCSRGQTQLPIREAWTIHELPDNSQIIRVDREDKDIFDATLLLEILRSATGQIERFDAQFYGGASRSIRQAKATFAVFDNRIQIGRTLKGQPQQHEEYVLRPYTIIYPNALVLLGSVIDSLKDTGNSVQVFSFGLKDKNLFMPQSDACELISVGDNSDIAGQVSADTYQVLYKNYDGNTRFWLDKYRTITKMETTEPDGRFIMTLTQYSRRPDKNHD